VVLLKVHQIVYDAVKKRIGDCDFLVPNSVPTNLVLGVADLLVTDYSSIFFDFLPTGRPVIHCVPDLDQFRSGRGLYLNEGDLPGPISTSVPELVVEVRAALAAPGRSERTRRAAEVYSAKDDGFVCQRITDLVFRGADESAYIVHRDFRTNKERLLIYLGTMKSMGITTSALNLLRNLDYDKYDVTAFYWLHPGPDRAKNIALVDPRVRVIPRVPVFNASPRRVREETKKMTTTGLGHRLDDRHRQFWSDEWQRMFGNASFDHLIDFSGYGCFAPFLFTVAKAKSRSIWLHNDMYADMQRETAGERHLEDRLGAVFTTYRYFDHLVSVSPQLERVNRDKLAQFAPPERFTYAVNTIDGARVLKMAGLSRVEARAKAIGHTLDGHAPEVTHRTVTINAENLASAMATMLDHFMVEDVLREARSRLRLGREAPGGTATFVTVGRLSPEKNHVRLIRAFAQVHERHPEIRLVIIGGGKLESDLEQLIVTLGLKSYVTLAGQVDNPYAIMADSDCFVLSSDYEGQPMVILEARTLGLPVITTAFSSVGDSVTEDAGIVVPQTVEGVAAGLERFLKGEVPAQELDTEEYNRRAMEQFDRVIASVRPGTSPRSGTTRQSEHRSAVRQRAVTRGVGYSSAWILSSRAPDASMCSPSSLGGLCALVRPPAMPQLSARTP